MFNVRFAPKKIFYASLASVALIGSGLVGGGALIRNQNHPNDTVSIDLSKVKQDIDKTIRHINSEYTDAEKAEMDVKELSMEMEKLLKDGYMDPHDSCKSFYRSVRDNSINSEMELDLEKTDNVLKITAIKAYALARLGVSHLNDVIEDMND